MNKNEQKLKLLKLKQEEQKFVILLENFNFKTENEALNYITENKSEFEKLRKIKMKIKEIEWSLLSEEEKKENLEKEKLLSKKYNK